MRGKLIDELRRFAAWFVVRGPYLGLLAPHILGFGLGSKPIAKAEGSK